MMNMDGNLKRNASENEKERILTRNPDLKIFDDKSPIIMKHVTIQNKPNTMIANSVLKYLHIHL